MGVDGLVEEDLADQQTRAEGSAGKEEKLRGQQDAGEVGAEYAAVAGSKSVEEDVGVELGEDLSQQNAGAEDGKSWRARTTERAHGRRLLHRRASR